MIVSERVLTKSHIFRLLYVISFWEMMSCLFSVSIHRASPWNQLPRGGPPFTLKSLRSIALHNRLI